MYTGVVLVCLPPTDNHLCPTGHPVTLGPDMSLARHLGPKLLQGVRTCCTGHARRCFLLPPSPHPFWAALLLDGPHLRHHVVRTCRVGALRVRPVGGRDEETNEKVGLTWVPGGSSHTESEEVFGGEVILARLAH